MLRNYGASNALHLRLRFLFHTARESDLKAAISTYDLERISSQRHGRAEVRGRTIQQVEAADPLPV